MKISDRIRYIFNRSKSHHVETIIISEKQCPHCASRGMFVFKSPYKSKSNNGELNEEHK